MIFSIKCVTNKLHNKGMRNDMFEYYHISVIFLENF